MMSLTNYKRTIFLQFFLAWFLQESTKPPVSVLKLISVVLIVLWLCRFTLNSIGYIWNDRKVFKVVSNWCQVRAYIIERTLIQREETRVSIWTVHWSEVKGYESNVFRWVINFTALRYQILFILYILGPMALEYKWITYNRSWRTIYSFLMVHLLKTCIIYVLFRCFNSILTDIATNQPYINIITFCFGCLQ